MIAEVSSCSMVKFQCSYEYPKDLNIFFKITSYQGLLITARGIELGPIIKTNLGAYRNWTVQWQTDPFNVECYVTYRNGLELARIKLSLKPGLTDYMSKKQSLQERKSNHVYIRLCDNERCYTLLNRTSQYLTISIGEFRIHSKNGGNSTSSMSEYSPIFTRSVEEIRFFRYEIHNNSRIISSSPN